MKKQTKTLAFTALLLAIGTLLPQLFHEIGSQKLGQALLPMHFAALAAALLVAPLFALVMALLLAPLGFLLTGMPPPPMLFCVMAELLAVTAVCGLMRKKSAKLPAWAALLTAQIVGRGVLFAGLLLLHLVPVPAAALAIVLAGWPGLALQLLLLPLITKILEKKHVLP
ncbi:MAG: hypothetical protein LBB50_06700 [Oscillospiraceae bacterium]|jgi:niacin transporter|nr:hypothetical protein [Oscillospiraceae bacterium]